MLYHMVVGAVCASDSVSAALQVLWSTYPLFRMRALYACIVQGTLALVAVHYVSKQRKFVVAKMFIVTGPVLASLCIRWWSWAHFENGIQPFRASTSLAVGVSLGFIQASTRSTALLACLALPLILASAASSAHVYNNDAAGQL